MQPSVKSRMAARFCYFQEKSWWRPGNMSRNCEGAGRQLPPAGLWYSQLSSWIFNDKNEGSSKATQRWNSYNQKRHRTEVKTARMAQNSSWGNSFYTREGSEQKETKQLWLNIWHNTRGSSSHQRWYRTAEEETALTRYSTEQKKRKQLIASFEDVTDQPEKKQLCRDIQ